MLLIKKYIVILGSNKRELEKQIIQIKEILKTLKLETHNDEIVKKTSMIDFVGYKHYGSYTTIRKRVFKRIRRTMLRIKNNICDKLARRMISYYGFIKHSNSYNLKQKYLSILNINKIKGVVIC